MKLFLKCFLIYSICFLSFNTQAQEVKLRTAAMDQLNSKLMEIPESHLAQFGFHSKNEFDKCTVGQQLQMLALTADDGGKMQLSPLNEWRVLVNYNSEARIFATITQATDQFKIVDIGGHELAVEIASLLKNSPNGSNYLLRLHSYFMDFVVVVAAEKAIEEGSFYPLKSAQKQIDKLQINNSVGYFTFSQVVDILSQLKNK